MDDEKPDYVTRRLEYQKRWYRENAERLKKKASDYYWAHHDEIRAKYQRKTPPRDVNYQSQLSPKHRHRYYGEVLAEKNLRTKIQAFQVVSGLARPACACGESDVRVLTINHLNGNGTAELRRGPYGVARFRQAIIDGTRKTDDLNVLCFNCNIRYEYERGKRSLPLNWESVLDEESDSYGRDI